MVNSQLLEWLSGNEKFVKELGAKNTLNRNLQKKFANEVLSKCKEEMENLFNKQSFTESEIQFLKTLQTKSDTIPNRIAKKMGKACSESGIVRKVFFETMVLQNFESLIIK